KPTAVYHASRLLTARWLQPEGPHAIYAAASDARDAENNELVRAYPVRRPDGRWAVLLINVDPANTYTARLAFKSGGAFNVAEAWQFSSAQYRWHADGADGYPELSRPAVSIAPSPDGTIDLPAYSITVVLTAAPRTAK